MAAQLGNVEVIAFDGLLREHRVLADVPDEQVTHTAAMLLMLVHTLSVERHLAPEDLTVDDVVNVFIPTTPNPTSGFLLFVPRSDLHVLEMTVEEGIKMVVSGGIVTALA